MIQCSKLAKSHEKLQKNYFLTQRIEKICNENNNQNITIIITFSGIANLKAK